MPAPHQRQALLALFDRTWPGISPAIAWCGELGWDWWAVSTPFSRLVSGRAVAHCGVLEVPLLVDGEPLVSAALHAVCTDRQHRGQGLSNAVIEEALAHVDARLPRAHVCTVVPEHFARFGFTAVEERAWEVAVEPERCGQQAVGPVDAELFAWMLPRRAPLSQRLCARDPGWLLGICEVLEAGDLSRVHLLEELEAAVIWEAHGTTVELLDVIAERMPCVEDLVPWLPAGTEQLRLRFCPDELGVDGVGAVATPPDGATMMVRGDWALGDEPVALPLLARS